MTQTTVDTVALMQLIEASRAMSDAQKEQLVKKLDAMPDTLRAKLYMILMQEQKGLNRVYHERLAQRNAWEQNRAKVIYAYIERKLEEEEDQTMEDIEVEMSNVLKDE